MGLPSGAMKGRSSSGSSLASVSITNLHGLMSGCYMGERMAEMVRTAKFCKAVKSKEPYSGPLWLSVALKKRGFAPLFLAVGQLCI